MSTESTDALIEVRDLSVSYHTHLVLDGISFSAHPGQLIGIIGPNGAGKSTLMKAILGLIRAARGTVTVWRQPVAKVRKRIAYVPQRSSLDLDFPLRVQDVVMMGRFPHFGLFSRPRPPDHALVADCLRRVGMHEFRNRQIGALSGGQQQRVFLARALAQEADLFLLDEPFAGIDQNSEHIIMRILRALRDQGKTAFIVFHDLVKAASYFDSLLLLNKRLIAFGPGAAVLTAERLRGAYAGCVTVLPGADELLVVNA